MIDLLTSAPTRATSMNCASSRPAPAQPAAASTRLGSSVWPSLALMSAGIALPPRGGDPPQTPTAHGRGRPPPPPPPPTPAGRRARADRDAVAPPRPAGAPAH